LGEKTPGKTLIFGGPTTGVGSGLEQLWGGEKPGFLQSPGFWVWNPRWGVKRRGVKKRWGEPGGGVK